LRRRIYRPATIGAVLVLAALILLPPVERVLGGASADSPDAVTITEYPDVLHQQAKKRKGVYVEYSQIPRCLEQAIISVEDKRFWLHAGIDPIAVIRVLLEDAENDHVDHGGSTITQQLARMILNLPHRRLPILAKLVTQLRIFRASFIIEHDFSKQTILELYLNSAYFGRGATGAATAAEAYFGTSLERLNEGKCVYLAGLVQAPTLFGANPSGERAIARYRHVIVTMERNGYFKENKALALSGEQLFSPR
jgi:membrane peptidoglycan carboxypeptidase